MRNKRSFFRSSGLLLALVGCFSGLFVAGYGENVHDGLALRSSTAGNRSSSGKSGGRDGVPHTAGPGFRTRQEVGMAPSGGSGGRFLRPAISEATQRCAVSYVARRHGRKHDIAVGCDRDSKLWRPMEEQLLVVGARHHRLCPKTPRPEAGPRGKIRRY